MTVIRSNSISGINSITAQSASLNFYDTSGNALSIGASVTGDITGNVTSSGISSFSGELNVGAGKSIRLYGATSGYSEIVAAAGSASTTFTLPANGGSASQYLQTDGAGVLSWAGAGKILQVVQGSTGTEVTISTTTYADTGLSASITPTSDTSKILVLVNQQFKMSRLASTQYGGIRLYRNTDLIYDPQADVTGPYEYGISAGGATSISFRARTTFSLLDEPASTSSLTYKTQARPYYSSSSGNLSFNEEDASGSTTSYIILLEVAA